MTTAVQDLIVSFEKLSNPERKIAVVEILRRSPPVSSPSIEDDEFLMLQAETFLELDACEAVDEVASTR